MNAVDQMAQALIKVMGTDGNLLDSESRWYMQQALTAYETAKERESQDERCMLHGEKTSYNGWSNYETWEIALELSNDETMYDTCTSLVESAGSVYDGAQELKRHYETMIDEILSCWSSGGDYGSKKRHMTISDIPFYSLYTASLSSVDWLEVARSFKPDEWGDSDTAPEDTEDTEDE